MMFLISNAPMPCETCHCDGDQVWRWLLTCWACWLIYAVRWAGEKNHVYFSHIYCIHHCIYIETRLCTKFHAILTKDVQSHFTKALTKAFLNDCLYGWCYADIFVGLVHVCPYLCLSFILSLSLPIICVVFPSLHVLCWTFLMSGRFLFDKKWWTYYQKLVIHKIALKNRYGMLNSSLRWVMT